MIDHLDRCVDEFKFLEGYGFELTKVTTGREPMLEFNRGYETLLIDVGLNPGMLIYAPASQFDGMAVEWAEKDGVQRGFRRVPVEFDDEVDIVSQMVQQLLAIEKAWLERRIT